MKVKRYRPEQLEFIYAAADAKDTENCILWPFRFDSHGYPQIWHPDFENSLRGHRMVLSLHDDIHVPKSNVFCRHLCHTRACINPHHLEWGNQAQNLADCMDDESNDKYPLTKQQVLDAVNDPRPSKVVAEELGVDASTISHIRIGRSWSHITGIIYKRKRLTADEALAIYHDNDGTLEQIAKRHNSKIGTVHHIKTGRNFANVTGHVKVPLR